MATEIAVAREFTDWAIIEHCAVRLNTDEASMVKWWAAELCNRTPIAAFSCTAAVATCVSTRWADPGRQPRPVDLRRHNRDPEGNHRPQPRPVALNWHFTDSVLSGSDTMLGRLLELALSGESMPGSGDSWRLSAASRDELSGLCGPVAGTGAPAPPTRTPAPGCTSARNHAAGQSAPSGPSPIHIPDGR